MATVMVSGSRTLNTREMYEYCETVVRRCKASGHSIVVGDAVGVDAAIAHMCRMYGVKCTVHGTTVSPRHGHVPSVAYVRHAGKSYTHRDNVLLSMSTFVVCVWDGVSRGTARNYKQASKLDGVVRVLHTCA